MLKYLLSISLLPLLLLGQGAPDSVITATPGVTDSLKVHTKVETKKKSVLTDKIPYKAERISISVDGNTIYLKGKAEIKYEGLTLTAAQITIDKKKNKLYAQGVYDSTDSKGNKHFTGNPLFEEKGQEPMIGERIEYDFETKRGRITVGQTEMEPGYYRGQHVHKIADSTLLVQDGYFTTCDLPHDPHFYFKSDKMRLKVRDKVVAKPIVFYLLDIPILAFPYAVFPSKGGRRSGIIVPSYGESRFGGRALENLGYYWAPNDYMDMKLMTTFYDKLGFTFRGNMRYKLRYKLNGGISGSYFPKDPASGQRRERWSFNYNHAQTIDPTFSIRGSGNFQSDKSFRRQTSANLDNRLKQNITSNLSMNKRWKGTKNSLSLSLRHQQNLQTDEYTYSAPSIRFSRGQSTLWETLTGEKTGSAASWYKNIYFNYNLAGEQRGSHKINEIKNELGEVIDTNFVDEVARGIQHNISLNSPQKLFKYFNINPSVSYREVWTDEITEGRWDTTSNKLVLNQKNKFAARRTFSGSVGIRTKIYGLFEPNIGALKFIRHTLSPSVSYNYTPDFSDASYGYFQTVHDSVGNEILVDKFSKSIYGGTGRRESQRMSLRLDNLFQGKLIDEEGKEEKIDLFKANFSTSYDYNAANNKHWGRLSSDYSTTIYGKSLAARVTHSLYTLDKSGNETNILVFDKGQLPRLTRFSTSFGYTLNNKTFEKKEEKKETSRREAKKQSNNTDSNVLKNAVSDSLDEDIAFGGSIESERNRVRKIDLPWSVGFNTVYSLNRVSSANLNETISLSANANFKLSKNWKINWRASFDLVEKKIGWQAFNIYRDLHCWEMTFSWQPQRQYYSFQINIKNPLQDIKVTKHPSNTLYTNY